jgi:hypothetical protein
MARLRFAACVGGTRKKTGAADARFWPNPSGRGSAGDPLRCEIGQAVQACPGFRALRLIPQDHAAHGASFEHHP